MQLENKQEVKQKDFDFKEFKGEQKNRSLQYKCNYCGKSVEESTFKIQGKYRIATLKCGHTVAKSLAEIEENANKFENKVKEYRSFIKGHELRHFQQEDLIRAEKTNGTFLLGHEMGLGKTPMALAYMHFHPEKFPLLIVCKSVVKSQWYRQVLEWCGMNYALCQIIDKGFSIPLVVQDKNWKVTIVSFDMLRRLNWDERVYSNFETVIIDECQHIKNSSTWRANEVRKIAKCVKNVIAASGTSVKNNAGEYFTVLNIMHPERFPKLGSYLDKYVETVDGGRKIGGIRAEMLQEFDNATNDFIFRRLRKDVMPDLPLIDRQFLWSELGDAVEKAYNAKQQEFIEAYDEADGKITSKNFGNLLAYINEMRQITGLAKIEPVADYVAEFLLQSNEKIVIFTHHENVTWGLKKALDKICEDGGFEKPLMYQAKGKMTEEQQDRNKELFISDPKYRILIASTLATGEGVDGLQLACSHMIMMERQWNPANEEQCESRFPRPGQLAQSIVAAYFAAIGTIDEWFYELVEKKRQFMKSTLDGEVTKWEESSLIKELMAIVAEKGRTVVTPQKKLKARGI